MGVTMRKQMLPRLLGALGATVLLLGVPLGCDDGAMAPETPTPVKASDWVSAANWDAATVVTVNMAEKSPTNYVFEPNNLTFEAGKPYILRITNPASNSSKHYFATEGLGDFYQAIATRKIETADAEYKAPHFEAVELQIGGTLELYFVAVLPGTYDILCTIPGHKQLGMFGTVTITGGDGFQLDLEVANDFNAALSTDPRKSSSHSVWTSLVDTTVTIRETPSYGYVPTDLALTKDVAYKIILSNPTGHASNHYYTAAQFYKTVVTRKAEDSQAEIKALYFKAVELMIGGTTELFVVPTVAGTFETLCTIPGHADLGMRGTIVVSP